MSSMRRVGIDMMRDVGRLVAEHTDKALLGKVGVVRQYLGESLPAHQRRFGAP